MDTFTQLSLIIVAATVISGIARVLKQPLVIGYIITGIIVGPVALKFIGAEGTDAINVFSEFGIASLLFIVGLHLSPRELTQLGKPSLIIGLLQVVLTFLLGFLISFLLVDRLIYAIYIGIAVSFSSTIVVLKFLSDKKDLDTLHSRVSIGILLLQDIIAALVLIGISTFDNTQGGLNLFLLLIIRALGLVLSLSLISFYILPRLSKFFAKSQEYLFLFSLAWGYGLATLFHFMGFSIEIGALLAGVTLSITPYNEEISAKLKPLRDFFIVIFYILLGARLTFVGLDKIFIPLILLILFVLIIKPLIIMMLAGIFGYKRKTGFMAGTLLSQISEFSLIIAIIGLKLGHINQDVFSLITITGVATITLSTYFMKYSENIFSKISQHLKIFEKNIKYDEVDHIGDYEIILFGCNRAGYDFIDVFKKMNSGFLAIDYDPEIIDHLLARGINVKYGDAEDGDFLDDINITKAKAVISTIPDFETNSFLITKIRAENRNNIIIATSNNIDHAISLYEKGADYVIFPHFLGGQIVSKIARDAVYGAHDLKQTKIQHLEYLQKRKSLGYTPSLN